MSSSDTLEVPGYRVVQYIGSGARSRIWQIRDVRTDEMFALKQVVKRHTGDYRFLEQAINEYQTASCLDHPVIRKITVMRKVKRWLSLREIHLVMEYCHGLTVQDRRPSDLREVLRIYSEVASGLAHINSRGFVHADIKPNNIVVAPSGEVKIIDLGQSCRMGAIKSRIQGTPDFIAPEQVHRRPLDARTDVFNFGASLYWTLTGRPIPTVLPKTNGSMLKADMIIAPPEQLNPDVPASLSKLVLDCVEQIPAHRPPSMSEVLSRLGLIAYTIERKANNAQSSGGQTPSQE